MSDGTTFAEDIPVRMTADEWESLAHYISPEKSSHFHQFTMETYPIWAGSWDYCIGIRITPEYASNRYEGGQRSQHWIKPKEFGPHYNSQRTVDKARDYLVSKGWLQIIDVTA